MMITVDDLVLRVRCKTAVWQVFKHLAGQHDQMSHGHSNSSAKIEYRDGIGYAQIIGNTKDGWDVYEVDKFDSEKLKNGNLAVNKRTGTTYYSRSQDISHGEMLEVTGQNTDNYVRFTYRNKVLGAMNSTAGSMDYDKGLDNIYSALDELSSKGFPDSTKVIILMHDQNNPYAKPTAIETSIKSYWRKD